MSTSSKRKRVVLSLEEKKEILQALERGVSGRSISEKYRIGTATVSDIKRKGRTILDYSEKWAQEGGCSNRKMMRTPKLEAVEEALAPRRRKKSTRPATDPGDWNADSDVNREVEEIMDTLRSTSICEKCERVDVER
ncbi:hypothetical protein M514_24078 [Trichuris suis]|uniref:HTH psq-type domain-containing protein n=1 Tax=Trichuris suis TaxID=68888 RepID=A0A085N2M9_9BILA|nr:hypothetical protein M514_24078 [Trichuris suis]